MPGPDLKDKELTDTPLPDSNDGQTSDDNLNKLNDEYQNSPQQQTKDPADFNKDSSQKQAPQGTLTGKAAKQARAEAWKRGKKKLLEQAAKRGSKWAAKKVGKEGAKKAITGAATAAGAPAGGVGGAATGAAAEGVMNTAEFGAKEAWRFAKNPSSIFTEPGRLVDDAVNKTKKWMIIISIGIVVFIVIFVVLFGGTTGWAEEQGLLEEEEENLVSVTKKGPEQVANGQEITYTITVASQDPTSHVVVRDRIPANTVFVRATGTVTCELSRPCTSASRTVTWNSADNNLTPPINGSFTITIRPTASNTYVINIASASRTTAAGNTDADKPVTCTGYQCALQYIVGTSSISSPYGARSGGFHHGIDISAGSGAPIYALEGGSVYDAVNSCAPNSGHRGNTCGGGAGNYVFIQTANKGRDKYMHMQRTTVTKGDVVTRGQVIGYVDHTGDSGGPHLHFQIDNPNSVNPATALANWPN